MKRVIAAAATLLIVYSLTGCIAVSAREVRAGARRDVVATPDGKIYVVDKYKLTAIRVRTFTEANKVLVE
jgi:hypothetical protein